jgi:hypothetical protein
MNGWRTLCFGYNWESAENGADAVDLLYGEFPGGVHAVTLCDESKNLSMRDPAVPSETIHPLRVHPHPLVISHSTPHEKENPVLDRLFE